MSDYPALPRHRHEMTLRLGANTLADLCQQLRVIANDLEHDDRDEARQIMSFGGWYLVIEHDPTMTPERYDTELSEWAAARRARQETDR